METRTTAHPTLTLAQAKALVYILEDWLVEYGPSTPTIAAAAEAARDPLERAIAAAEARAASRERTP